MAGDPSPNFEQAKLVHNGMTQHSSDHPNRLSATWTITAAVGHDWSDLSVEVQDVRTVLDDGTVDDPGTHESNHVGRPHAASSELPDCLCTCV